MPRNRFELFLSVFQCNDNANANEDNRLYEIQDLVENLFQHSIFVIYLKNVCALMNLLFYLEEE